MEAKIHFGDSMLQNPKPVDAYLFQPALPETSTRPCYVNSLYNICKFMASGETQSGLKATAEGVQPLCGYTICFDVE